MSNYEQLFAAIEQRLAELEKRLAGNRPAAQSNEVADDDLLSKPWADMEIRKDPPRSSQPSHLGKRMSECSSAYLLDYASFHDWKAKKGREENPPRLNNKGKPWYESDELVAKVARGWAERAKQREADAPTIAVASRAGLATASFPRPAAKPAARPQYAPPASFGDPEDDSIPF